ncbi:unnamed protein product [Phytomonas sp. EM1]|nr:unnamed protein product [Phytomonas sp. EM1]|eukprot:CCW62256.1 unnamed protein product [Phytomonas sp. isolate EM1]
MSFYNRLALALGLNFFLRSITFTLTVYLTRILLPSQSGMGFVYTLYVDFVLFTARDAIRSVSSRTNLRKPKHASEDSPLSAQEGCKNPENIPNTEDSTPFSGKAIREVVNLSLLSVPLAFIIVVILEISVSMTGLHILPSLWANAWKTTSQPLMQSQVQGSKLHAFWMHFIVPIYPELIVWLSIVIRLLSEPCVALVHSLNMIHVVVIAEFFSITGRQVTVISLIHFYGMHSSWDTRMFFALGQLACSVANISYYALLLSGRPSVWRWLGGSTSMDQLRVVSLSKGALQTWRQAIIPFPWCDIEFRKIISTCYAELHLLGSFFVETLLRVVLSGGESLALSTMGTAMDRGIYHLIINLGSTVVRLVFHVWESSCFVRWSQDVARGQINVAVDLLCVMTRLAFYLGFSFTLLVSPMTPLILKTLYTSHWTSPSSVYALQCYFCSLPLIAVLGLLESFLRAVASPTILSRFQRVMTTSSFFYILLCYALLRYGVSQNSKLEGNDNDSNDSKVVVYLIAANIMNAVYRICCVLYLLICTDERPRGVFQKAGDAQCDSSLSSSDGGDVNSNSFKPSGIHARDGRGVERKAILTIKTLKRASISPYLMAYLALLLVFSSSTTFSLLKIIAIGVLYVVGILYWDDTVLSFLCDTLSAFRVLRKKKHD